MQVGLWSRQGHETTERPPILGLMGTRQGQLAHGFGGWSSHGLSPTHPGWGEGCPSGLRYQIAPSGVTRSRSSNEGVMGRGCGHQRLPVTDRLQDPAEGHTPGLGKGCFCPGGGSPTAAHLSSSAPLPKPASPSPFSLLQIGGLTVPHPNPAGGNLSTAHLPGAMWRWLQAWGRPVPPSAEVQEEEATLSVQL